MLKGELKTAALASAYALAGDATLTLISKKTETRFTYRVRKPDEPSSGPVSKVSHFVAVLVGPDNSKDFKYLGHMFSSQAGVRYVHGRKSTIGETAPSARAFAWFWSHIARGVLPSEQLEVWHEGTCCRCGRKLTVPSSVAAGIGPDCANKM